MRKTTAFTVACGALALLTATASVAQDWRRDERRDDRRGDQGYDRRDDRRGPPGGADLVLFEHRDFGGEARPIRGDEPDFVRLGFNDRVSSFRILRGEWEFCEDAYFRGRCWRYSHDMGVLPNKQNDRYSSVRRVR